jgi:hypothetical protein
MTQERKPRNLAQTALDNIDAAIAAAAIDILDVGRQRPMTYGFMTGSYDNCWSCDRALAVTDVGLCGPCQEGMQGRLPAVPEEAA